MSVRVTIPGSPAVTWAEADAHLVLDGDTSQQPYVEGLIAAAQSHIEKTLDLSITTTTLEATSAGETRWIGSYGLPRGPVRSIIEVRAGSPSAIVSPDLYALSGEHRLRLEAGTVLTGELVVTYTAGDAPADVPAPIKHAILLLVGHWFANREAVVVGGETARPIPFAAEALLAPYQTWRV